MSPLLRRSANRAAGPRRRLSPVVIGALAAAALLIFAIGVFRKDVPFKHGHRIDVMFRSSNQLIKGSPVRIAGIDAGKVVKLGPGPGGTTQIVRMELKRAALPIHEDATARIRPRLFLEGGFYIELRPGSPSAKELDDGDTIPVGNTSTPVQFNQILSELTTPVRQSLRTTLEEFDTALGKGGAEGFGRVSKPLAPALRDTTLLAEATQGTAPHDLSGVISTGAKTAQAIAESRAQLASLVTAVAITTGALASDEAALATSIRELDGVMREAPAALTAFDRSLPSLNRTSRAILPSLPLLPGVLDDGAKLLVQLRLASRPGELPRLIANLKPSLARLPKLGRQLTTLLGLVTPVTDCLRDNALPILKSEVPDGRLSTGYPVYLDLAHALVGLSGAAGNFDANGPIVRYNGGAGTNAVSIGGTGDLTTLFGSSVSPILGSNPQYLGRGVDPPKRPDRPCRDQDVANLRNRNSAVSSVTRAATAAATRNRPGAARPARTPKLSLEQVRGLLAEIQGVPTGGTR